MQGNRFERRGLAREEGVGTSEDEERFCRGLQTLEVFERLLERSLVVLGALRRKQSRLER